MRKDINSRVGSRGEETPNCPPGKFYATPKELLRLYGLLPGVNANVIALYSVLRDYRNDEKGGIAWPSKYLLEFELGISIRTIDRGLSVLEEYGLIAIEKRSEGNVYHVYEPLPLESFIVKYPQAVEEYRRRCEKMERQRSRDADKMRQWRAKNREGEDGAQDRSECVQPESNAADELIGWL